LKRDVKSVIEGRGAANRIPALLHFWVWPGNSGDNAARVQELLDRYPQDILPIGIAMPGLFEGPADDPNYRWLNWSDPHAGDELGIDERVAMSDYSRIDEVMANFPSADYPGMFPDRPAEDGRYRLAIFWNCLFERHWTLRGMANALVDYYAEPEGVHRLFRGMTDFYKRLIERAKTELNADGIFTSDDIGMQTGTFFSLDVFREFYKPYYKEIIEKAHSLGMHFWLHTCGNVEAFMPDLIEIGLDVIHPIQKYTMDEKAIAAKFGKDICIWGGFDVQRTIPFGTPEEVRNEVRFMIDTYQRPDGRFMLTAGNGVHGDCTVESLTALFEETFEYGSRKR
jgi:uroporphyrinogen decarboxylase